MNNKIPYDHTDELAKRFKIPYQRSKEQVWDEMKALRKTKPNRPSKNRRLVLYTAVAASGIVLIGLLSFLRFYSETFYAPAGQHMAFKLPDNSRVHLNAGTKVSYHPYWWHIDRQVQLSGEAYFEVSKGENFTVVSELGTTRVLGTTFNVFARETQYHVFCLTGKVEVKNNQGKTAILSQNQSIAITPSGELKEMVETQPEHAISWTKNEFVFTEAPLNQVFEEMERQFAIQIKFDLKWNGTYTGKFQRGSSPLEVLELVARPFNLKIEKINQNQYVVSK